MPERLYNVQCNFYEFVIPLRLPDEDGVISALDVCNRVRAAILASGDEPPPASQLLLSFVTSSPGREDQVTHISSREPLCLAAVAARHGERHGVVQGEDVYLRVNKKPGKVLRWKVASKKVSGRRFFITSTSTKRDTPSASSDCHFSSCGSWMPWCLGKKKGQSYGVWKRGRSLSVRRREMEQLLPLETH